MGPRTRVALDATPLLGNRTGIGRYVEHLVAELAALPDLDVRAAAFSLRRRGPLAELPPGVRAVHRPVPARLLHAAWLRGDHPSAEVVTGRADVVHGTNFVLPPPRRAAGVVTVHDLSFDRYPELVDRASLAYRELVPRAVARAAAVLTPSRTVGDEVAERYRVPADRLHVTPLGVDPSWLRAGDLPLPAGFPSEYLVAVGTLEPRKGLDVLLSAYRALLTDEPDAPPLVLVGPNGWGPELATAGIPAERLVLPGYRTTAQVQALVAHARALVYPSRYEGFGLPPLEALAAGTPVIASDLPTTREVAGGHVRTTPVGDVAALADALAQQLRTGPDGAAVEAGRAHAADYTWQRCAADTAAVYRAVAR